MALLLGLLPLFAFALAVLALGNSRQEWKWDTCFLRAAVALGAYAVLGTELLGLVHAIRQWTLTALWLVPVVAFGALLVRRGRAGQSLRVPRGLSPRSVPEWIMASVLALVLAGTAVVALMAPPNTWDSLTYHMSRVAHWAQAGSLQHYPSGIERQNFMSPGAEIGMLQLYVLVQGDRLVNFIQWSAMVGCLVGAGAIARRLGAPRLGQMAAAVFAATLPMGLAQATSTMTDYVVAFWVTCVAYETVELVLGGPVNRETIVPLGLAAGLTILAKPTSYGYLPPFAIVVAVAILRRGGLRSLLVAGGVAGGMVVLVNAGYLGRNLQTYGNPLGNARAVGTHSNEIFDGRVFISNLMRNASLHAETPWPAVNDFVYRAVIWTHLKLGIDVTDPRTSVHPVFRVDVPEPEEASSGNPVHAAIAVVLLGVLGIAAVRRDRGAAIALGYLGLAAAGFVLLSSLFQFTVFGSRYHLPFFVLVAPAFGYAVTRMRTPWLAVILAVGLLFASRAWILELRERPLIPDEDGRSVLTWPRQSLYFVLAPGLEEPYRVVVNRVLESACTSVGIMFSGDGAEYPVWPLFGEPIGKTRLEWIVAGTPSARTADPDFEPCAVICDGSCPAEWQSVRDLPLSLEVGSLRLYASP